MGDKIVFSRGLALVLIISFILCSCRPDDFSKIPAYSRQHYLQAVIEIPAGTNLKISYCQLTHRFRVEMMDGVEKKVEFLPYPVNFGFIPSTSLKRDTEDNGEMLDVVVISEKLHTGTVLEIIPLGVLILKDEFYTDYKILAIPADPSRQVVHASSLHEINEHYPALTGIIEQWFISSHFGNDLTVLGWENELTAQQFIGKWLVRKQAR